MTRDHYKRLSLLAQEHNTCQRWRFHGFEREGSKVLDPSQPASEFEWRIEVDFESKQPASMPTTSSCDHTTPKKEDTVRGTIWWKKVKSRWGNTRGMGAWEIEELEGNFDPEKKHFVCRGVRCGAGLACGTYCFELKDNGLSLVETGTQLGGTLSSLYPNLNLGPIGNTTLEQYMVGLAEDQLIPDPVGFVKKMYFPGDPPGTLLPAQVD